MTSKTTAAERPRAVAERGTLAAACLAAWIVPGAGHLWFGRRQKGFVFLTVLPLMFLIGLFLEGRIFPFVLGEPLAALAAVADMGLGLPWAIARMLGEGEGTVTAVTYEYGNTFLIAAGLLNFLVILDVYDIAMGRK